MTKNIELLREALKLALRVQTLQTEEEKSKEGVSGALQKVAKTCETEAQWKGNIETFKIHLRTAEGASFLKSLGAKLEEKTKTEGDKTITVYLLPRSFIQPASNIARAFRLADAGKLYREADVAKLEKGEKVAPVKVAAFETESELRAATQESKRVADAVELKDAAAQGRQVRRNGVLVDAKEEAMRTECLAFIADADRAARLLRGERLVELRTSLMEVSQQAKAEIVAQKKADDEAKAQVQAEKMQAETDANAAQGQLPAPVEGAEVAPGMEAHG